jgi:hypothetical protein
MNRDRPCWMIHDRPLMIHPLLMSRQSWKNHRLMKSWKTTTSWMSCWTMTKMTSCWSRRRLMSKHHLWMC